MTSHVLWDTSVGNRFAYNSPEDHTGPLWIAALLGIVYVISALIVRVYVKRRILDWDDYLVMASSVRRRVLLLRQSLRIRGGCMLPVFGNLQRSVLRPWEKIPRRAENSTPRQSVLEYFREMNLYWTVLVGIFDAHSIPNWVLSCQVFNIRSAIQNLRKRQQQILRSLPLCYGVCNHWQYNLYSFERGGMFVRHVCKAL